MASWIDNNVLKLIPKRYYNKLTLLGSLLSLPLLGCPIDLKRNGIRLKEYTLSELTLAGLLNSFIEFCYLKDEKSIQIDKAHYWNHASFFIAFNQKNEIIGCLLFIKKEEGVLLPIEYGYMPTKNLFCVDEDHAAELYRLRRSFKLKRSDVVTLIMLIFKAVCMKTNHTQISYTYCTFDPDNKELLNLYEERLDFQSTDKLIQYEGDQKYWQVYKKSWIAHDLHFAKKSYNHFKMAYYFRKSCVRPLLKKHYSILWQILFSLRECLYFKKKGRVYA